MIGIQNTTIATNETNERKRYRQYFLSSWNSLESKNEMSEMARSRLIVSWLVYTFYVIAHRTILWLDIFLNWRFLYIMKRMSRVSPTVRGHFSEFITLLSSYMDFK